MLEGKNLVKSSSGRKIIDNINIELEPGEINVIIGPSGAGKTTLLKLLALLEKPDSGSIVIDDKPYIYPAQSSETPPWPTVTVVFQQLFLWPHLTLLHNIKLPHQLRNKHDQKIERRTSSDISDKTNEEPEQRRLEDLIELFDMKDFVNRYPNEASLGQRQRAALVRALILQPRYLLLDEITSSLDVEQIAIILSYLKRLTKKGIGILIITHLLNFAREAADKVIFVDSGQIIESGGREVLDSPKHERVKKFLSVIESAS